MTAPPARQPAAEPLQARELGKLKWRCKRGLLENDLFIERFFTRHEPSLTAAHARGLTVLMDLADNDLLDLLLRRKEPAGATDTHEVREVLELMRICDAKRTPPDVGSTLEGKSK
ncbi:succinate dehydrogenase assembly factor 2 [Ramlibacter sp. H39-3-26]|uniref:FAD assembly factor SdhE n=1 Tax=Curvibacter soli TaxID=3031331 RepID=UPI0023DB7993|nr:succinate dehydrogenase assembly factor 2 [Ramlibacter sp. H39-3-26]MDF1483865.1 succinate dehydrogenase assembly factor 2 [Ramlibacter sp. H39-3-26]